GLIQQLAGEIEAVFFHQRVAGVSAACFDEGVSHAAADEQVVHKINEPFEQQYFVAHFGAADDGGERAGGVVEHFIGVVYFGFHEVAEGFVVGIEKLRDGG